MRNTAQWHERPLTTRTLIAGRTLTEIARRTGLPLSTVSYILNGRVNPSFDSGIAIAKVVKPFAAALS